MTDEKEPVGTPGSSKLSPTVKGALWGAGAALVLAAAGLVLMSESKAGDPVAPAPVAAPQMAAAASTAAPIHGKIVEAIDAGAYTYLRVETPSGEAWAAVMKAPLAVGQHVTIDVHTVMERFESKTLGRTFEEVAFGALAGGEEPEGAHSHAGEPAAAPHGGPLPSAGEQAAPAVDPVPRAPSPEGRTVAELYAQKAALVGKRVSVRGRVVKASNGIMGLNWLHLQDGSGSSQEQNNDLTVTTLHEAKVGDVLLLQGILRTDRDVGAGYVYAVLLEEAAPIDAR